MHPIHFPLRASRRRLAGFTLIELMITVAIIAILARIAYPIYTQSIMKSRRADAKAALLDLASREERFFGTNNIYSSSGPALGYAAGSTLTAAAPLPVLSGSKAYYNLSVSLPADSSTFTATATPVTGSGQDNDAKCGAYTLTQAGVQGAGGTDGAATCW